MRYGLPSSDIDSEEYVINSENNLTDSFDTQFISVICPVFNTDPTMLDMAIKSVLSQKSSNDLEMIIVDDASTSAATIAYLNNVEKIDRRIRLIFSKKNQGPSLARHLGVQAATGKWTGFIDADDIWPEGTLEYRRNLVSRYPDCDWTGGDFARLVSNGDIISNQIDIDACTKNGDAVALLSGDRFTDWLISNTWFHLGAHMFKTELLIRNSIFRDKLYYGEDWINFLRLSTNAGCIFTREVTYILRRQHESLMTSPGRATMLYAQSNYLALKDPSLIKFHRQLRWALYSRLKGIALDNAMRGNVKQSMLFALRAYLIDPREIAEFFTLIRILLIHDTTAKERIGRKYSSARLSVTE